MLVGPGAQTTGALSGLEVRPAVGVAVAVTPSLSLLGTVGLVWNRRPDPLLQEGALVRFVPASVSATGCDGGAGQSPAWWSLAPAGR